MRPPNAWGGESQTYSNDFHRISQSSPQAADLRRPVPIQSGPLGGTAAPTGMLRCGECGVRHSSHVATLWGRQGFIRPR